MTDPRPDAVVSPALRFIADASKKLLRFAGFFRTDCHLATPALGTVGALARHASIYKTVKFSDHAPITVDYEFTL